MSREGGELDEVLDLVAHDLRNPLSAILTAAEVLRRRTDLQPGLERTIGRLRSSAERMATMIDQLEEWARAQVGHGVELDRGEADLHQLCRGLVEDLPAEQASRVRLATGGDGRGSWDATRLAQLLVTLVGNALDHGDPEAPVEVRASGDEKCVRLEVENAGPPIGHELEALLFDPVARRRAQRPSKPRGLGFGLWLARAIAVEHGGSLTLRSTEKSTLFTLQLPR